MRDGEDDQVRNWCALKLISILLAEDDREDDVAGLLAGMKRDGDNRLKLDAEGWAMFNQIKERLPDLS